MCFLLLLNLEYVLPGTFDPCLTFPLDACTFFRVLGVFGHEALNPTDEFFFNEPQLVSSCLHFVKSMLNSV